MSVNDSKKSSQTDWKRVDAMSDEDIDTFDIPPLDETFFANAQVRLPERKAAVSKTALQFKSGGAETRPAPPRIHQYLTSTCFFDAADSTIESQMTAAR